LTVAITRAWSESLAERQALGLSPIEGSGGP
jgi:hypothetical protein